MRFIMIYLNWFLISFSNDLLLRCLCQKLTQPTTQLCVRHPLLGAAVPDRPTSPEEQPRGETSSPTAIFCLAQLRAQTQAWSCTFTWWYQSQVAMGKAHQRLWVVFGTCVVFWKCCIHLAPPCTHTKKILKLFTTMDIEIIFEAL